MDDKGRSTRRSSRRLIATLAAVVVVVVAFFVIRAVLAPPEGFLLGLAPLDDRQAVVTFRYNGDDVTRSWAARVDASSGLRWYTELPLLARPSLYDDGITVGDGIATVRLSESGRYAIDGLSLDNGGMLWHTEIADLTDSGLTLAWSTPRYLVEWNAVTSGALWFVLDRHTGELLWHDRVDDSHGAAAAIWGELVVRAQGATVTISTLESGEDRYRARIDGGGCLVGDDLFIPRADGLYRLDLQTMQETVAYSGRFPDIGETSGSPNTFHPNGCAPREGLIFFWDPNTATLLAIDPGAAEIAWQITLIDPDRQPMGLVSIREWSGAGPGNLARTPLPRYVVLGLSAGEVGTERLWVVDLDARRIAGRTAADRTLIHYGLVRRGALTYLWQGGELALFDGDVGRFERTSQVDGMGEDVEPGYLRDNSLWLIGMAWTHLDQAWWAVFDPTTLALETAGNADYSARTAPVGAHTRFALESFASSGWSAPAESFELGTGEGTGAP